jgi:ABC-type transport system involved in multi-copper enzyme maturation permease subunit
MVILPILHREMKRQARSRLVHWMRAAVVLAGVAICVSEQLWSGASLTPPAIGRQMFTWLVAAAFLTSCCACLLSADIISAERREGTLGLLFLTAVRSYDVLFGKLIPVTLNGVCLLISFLPVLMVPVFAGGVTIAEAFRTLIAMVSTLGFALAAGLWVSSSQRERGRAVTGSLTLMLGSVIVPMVLVHFSVGRLWILDFLSPLFLVQAARNASYQSSPGTFWCALVVVQVGMWGMLLWAGRRITRSVGDDAERPIKPQKQASEEAKRSLGLVRWRPTREESEPVEWLVHRHGVSGFVWAPAMLLLTSSRWIAFAGHLGSSGFFGVLVWPLGFVGALLGSAILAWVASRFFAGTRAQGELELLLTTPVGAATVLSEQWKVLKRLFIWPILLMQLAMLVPMMALSSPAGSAPSLLGRISDPLGAGLSLANTWFGTEAVCWLGLWFGLKASGRPGAIIRVVALAAGLPWAFLLFCFLFLRAIPALGWLQEAAVLCFFVYLNRLTKSRLQSELAGIESQSSSFPLDFSFGDSGTASATTSNPLQYR